MTLQWPLPRPSERLAPAHLSANGRRKWATKQRHRARAAVVAQSGAPDCPRPDKPAYDLDDPEQYRAAYARAAPDMQLYRCRCGFHHWGHPVTP